MCTKLNSFPFQENGTISGRQLGLPMTMTYGWHESYKAALLETDWTKMQERVQAAVYEIHARRRVLSEDHGGTPEERYALADAMNILRLLCHDVTSRQDRQDLQSREA
jgi:hypothetical protein